MKLIVEFRYVNGKISRVRVLVVYNKKRKMRKKEEWYISKEKTCVFVPYDVFAKEDNYEEQIEYIDKKGFSEVFIYDDIKKAICLNLNYY